MEFVADLWHRDLSDPPAVSGRGGIDVHDPQRIIEFATRWIDRRNERIFFRRRLHGQPRRRVEGGIGFE